MVDKIDISLFGDKRLSKLLNKIETKEAKKIVRDSIKEGAEPVLQRAISLAPRRTGKLKEGLKLRASTRKRRVAVFIETQKRAHFGIDSSDPYFYPAVVEYGSPSRNIPAKPYLRPALEERRQRAIQLTGRGIKRRVYRRYRK